MGSSTSKATSSAKSAARHFPSANAIQEKAAISAAAASKAARVSKAAAAAESSPKQDYLKEQKRLEEELAKYDEELQQSGKQSTSFSPALVFSTTFTTGISFFDFQSLQHRWREQAIRGHPVGSGAPVLWEPTNHRTSPSAEPRSDQASGGIYFSSINASNFWCAQKTPTQGPFSHALTRTLSFFFFFFSLPTGRRDSEAQTARSTYLVLIIHKHTKLCTINANHSSCSCFHVSNYHTFQHGIKSDISETYGAPSIAQPRPFHVARSSALERVWHQARGCSGLDKVCQYLLNYSRQGCQRPRDWRLV